MHVVIVAIFIGFTVQAITVCCNEMSSLLYYKNESKLSRLSFPVSG